MLDTKDLVLKTLIAHLQIRGLVKEETSYFETADVQLLDAGRHILDEGTEEAIGDLPRECVDAIPLMRDWAPPWLRFTLLAHGAAAKADTTANV